jgi:uncharacterized cupredoxin-like copper-binding protein
MFLSKTSFKALYAHFTLISMFALLLLLLAACGKSSIRIVHTSPRQALISESDFHISSSVTMFTPGVPYHFVVQNKGHVEHELMLMPANMDMTNGMAMHRMDQMALLEVAHLAPGQTKTLDYTFPDSTIGEHLQLACHYPGHYQAGMSLNVMVASQSPSA